MYFVGSINKFIDDVPAYFSLVLHYAALLDPLLFLALWYCTGVLLAVGRTCFLCSVHGGNVYLVPLISWCILPLLLIMVELSGLNWEFSALYTWIPHLDTTLEVGWSILPPLEVYSSSS